MGRSQRLPGGLIDKGKDGNRGERSSPSAKKNATRNRKTAFLSLRIKTSPRRGGRGEANSRGKGWQSGPLRGGRKKGGESQGGEKECPEPRLSKEEGGLIR